MQLANKDKVPKRYYIFKDTYELFVQLSYPLSVLWIPTMVNWG